MDESGYVVILKNNKPRYLLMAFGTAEGVQDTSQEQIRNISEKLIEQNREVYEELEK